MKAAIVEAAGQTPVYRDLSDARPAPGLELVSVRASALSNFSKSRSTGAHYSSARASFPAVAGAEGVGTLQDGRRVYFVLPQAPTGALAEACLVAPQHCVDIPDGLDDVSAAALANPGMSAWAALVERAALKAGDTVLVNGATGSAGRMAVLLAKHLGAGRVIATGRNSQELEALRSLGADSVIGFKFAQDAAAGSKAYEDALAAEFARGIDVVIDYLWGLSAKSLIVTIAKSVEDGHPVRFVHVGSAGGEDIIELPGAALRSSAIHLMGSGLKSVPFDRLLAAVRQVFKVAAQTKLRIPVRVASLQAISEVWDAPGAPRVVVAIGSEPHDGDHA